MRNFLSKFLVVALLGTNLTAATGTPSSLVVRVDANGYLVVTAATQTNPITQGVFSSRVLKTDASGNLQVILAGTVTPTYPLSIPASTCAAPSLGLSGGPTTGIAFTATPSILECISGTAVTTITSSSVTSTIRYLLLDGTGALPTYSFTNFNNYGMSAASNVLFFSESGNSRVSVDASGSIRQLTLEGLQLAASSGSGVRGNSADTFLNRLSAGVWNMPRTALTTTSSDGLIVQNTTAALVGTTVQISPRIRLSGTAWDTDDAVSRTVSFFTENLPSTGNTVTGTWKLGYIDPVSSAITYPVTVNSAGSMALTGNLSGNQVLFDSASNNTIGKSTANGLMNFTNNGATVGIQFNEGTAAPTVTSCGTGTVSANSRNTAGEITATGATACTVTFGAPNWTNSPFCVVTGDNALVTTPYVSARSASAFTVSGLTAGDKFSYVCVGGV